MSAFITSDKTVNQVISRLSTNGSPWEAKVLGDVGHNVDTPKGQDALGRAMRRLNIQAVAYRYEDRSPEDFNSLPFSYRYELCDQFQALKSLRCWLYQCMEGDCPNDALYQAFEKISHAWADGIVDSLPAYDKAVWDPEDCVTTSKS